MPLSLDAATRRALWERVAPWLERAGLDGPLAPSLHAAERWDFDAPHDPVQVFDAIARGLREGIVQVASPRYFGLFNPAPADVAVAAAALVAAFNPQLATRSHAPWPVDVERQVLQAFGARFGFAATEGTFTSGGAEANATALWCALHAAHPSFADGGARALGAQPTVYVSAEGHATISRAARLAGLGRDAVRIVPADKWSRLKTSALREAIARDVEAGFAPLLIVGTAGTTSAGAVDPLDELARIAERAGAWFHVDAAWGGLLALLPEHRAALAGIERADSITFDAHKALAAPMGAGMYLSRRIGQLARTFDDKGSYMPRDASLDPYAHSAQWSRRFIGLPVFATLATVGFAGYAEVFRAQLCLAERLREGLVARGWALANDTPLPVVCFSRPDRRGDEAARGARRDLDAVARAVIGQGDGWLSVTRLSSGQRVLRACIDNHRTAEADVDRLLAALER